MDWRVRSDDDLAGRVRQSIGVPGVAIVWLSRCGDGLAESVWRSFGMSEGAIKRRGDCDNQLACSEWRSFGISEVGWIGRESATINWRAKVAISWLSRAAILRRVKSGDGVAGRVRQSTGVPGVAIVRLGEYGDHLACSEWR